MTDRELIRLFADLRSQCTTVIGFKHLCYDTDKPYSEAARIEHFAHLVSASIALAESVMMIGDTLCEDEGRQ